MSELVEFGTTLRFRKLETQLRRQDFNEGTGQLEIDMSLLERVDPSTLAGVVILADRVTRMGGSATLRTPLLTLSPAEQDHLSRIPGSGEATEAQTVASRAIRSRPRRRRTALDLLNDLGFISQFPQNENGTRTYSRSFSIGISDLKVREPETILPIAIPLWYVDSIFHTDPNSQEPAVSRDHAKWLQGISMILSQSRRLISESSAETLASISYIELVSNVGRHAWVGDAPNAAPPSPLVTAQIDPGGTEILATGLGAEIPEFQEYLTGLKGQDVPTINLWVGDSGTTIPVTIDRSFQEARPKSRKRSSRASEIEAIYFALSPLGSRHLVREPHPGVRGLARLTRLVRENRGAILIRSGSALAGYCYPDRVEKPISQQRLPYFPGTLVQVTVPALRRSLRHRAIPNPDRTRSDVTPTQVLVISKLSASAIERMESMIREATTTAYIFVLATQVRPTDDEMNTIASTFSELANRYEDSALLALAMPHQIGDEVVQVFGTLDDAREQHVDAHLEHANIPAESGVFITLTGDGGWAFHGGSERVRGLLYRVASHEAQSGDLALANEIIRMSTPGWNWLTPNGSDLRSSPAQLNERLADEAHNALSRRIAGGEGA